MFFKNGYNQPGAQDLRYIFLGGLPIMGKKELRAWLAARRELGCLHVAATYCGVGSSHDYNCSCAGHFNFQTKAQSIAADLGMSNLQRIIITSANLPQLNELLVKLNAVGHESTRQAFLMFYNGRGKLFENERPTLRQLLKQTPAVQELYRKNLADWKTEDGWAKALFVGKEFRQSDRIALRITAENIASLKDMSCEDLILDLTERTRCVYADIPSRQELAADYSDKANPKLYMTSWDVERLWLDRFMVKNPHISIDHSLLHFCL
ncbi:MAG: hypothetical protein LBD82_07850 [Deltaproteobacteria bacterium]|nr:hypothetical protein [Deltaproteobacteria bacterium]